jgi:DNA-binding NarL/FixJ family response regulator
MTIKILLADDQSLVRAGFRLILQTQEDMEVIGEAADGNDAVRICGAMNPDIVLMDIRMPALDGITATGKIARTDLAHSAKVVILTTYDLDEYVYDALAAGASGFLLKDVPPEELIRGVRVVAAGDALLAPSITRRLIAEFTRRPRRPPSEGRLAPPLTARELEVLGLVARGESNAEIGRSLSLSENTVKTHVTHILDKLALRDRVQAVIYAYENAIVEPGRTR